MSSDPAADSGPDSAEPGVLKPADKDLLAAAIREGMAPDPPSWPGIFKSIAFVIALTAVLIAAYQVLQRWRPPVALSVTADQTVPSQQITFGGGGGGASTRWKVTSANVASLQITGPESDVIEIDLPLPPSACPQVATELGPSARCAPFAAGEAPAVEFASPLALNWSSAVPLELLPPPGTDYHQSSVLGVTSTAPATSMPTGGSAAVAATPSTAAAPAMPAATSTAITIVADKGSDRQRWCFESPLSANKLQLQRGANSSPHAFSGAEADVVCGSGLRLLVGSQGPARQPPAITLQAVASLRLETLSTQQDAQSVVGQLHIGSGSTVLGTPTELVARAGPSAPLATTLFQQAGRSTLTVKSPAATSVLTDNGNLVSSIWDREQAFTLPILLTFAGALVPILLATMQGIMSAHRVRHGRTQGH